MAQVTPYMVATARCLLQFNLDSTVLATVRTKRDKLRTKLFRLEEEKQKLEERYDLFVEYKASREEPVAMLAGSVQCFSQVDLSLGGGEEGVGEPSRGTTWGARGGSVEEEGRRG